MLLEFLKSKFGPGKPIFTEDAESLGLSAGNLRQQFKKLVDARDLWILFGLHLRKPAWALPTSAV